MKLVKYGASWCGMCKVLDKQLNDNPPNCDVVFKSCDEFNVMDEAAEKGIRNLPCCVLYADDECTQEVARFNGIVKTEDINIKIKEYESEHMV